MMVCPQCDKEFFRADGRYGKYWGYCSFECMYLVHEPKRLAEEAKRYAERGIPRVTCLCAHCGKEFQKWANKERKKYCSDDCGNKARYKTMADNKRKGLYAPARRPEGRHDREQPIVPMETATCAQCGCEFERRATRHIVKLYCSSSCAERAAQQQYRRRGRWVVFNRDNFTCFYCGVKSYEGAELAVDHVQAYSNGGGHIAANLVTCCQQCNAEKHTDQVIDLDGVLAEIRRRNARAGLRDTLRIKILRRTKNSSQGGAVAEEDHG